MNDDFSFDFKRRGCIVFIFLLLTRFYWIVPTNKTFEYLRIHLLTSLKSDPLIILKTHAKLLMPFEYFLLLLVFLSLSYLAYLEIKHSYFSGLCETIRTNSKFALIATTYLVTLSAAPYLSLGMPTRNDSIFHIFPAWCVYQSFLEARFSLFTNFIWYGYPYAQNFGPSFSVVAGFLGWILRDWLLSFKLILCIFHIGSGLMIYLYVFHRTRSRLAALISALAYCFIYFRYHWLINMGRLRYGIHLCAFPLIWYFADQYLLRRRRKEVILLGLILSILILTQPGPQTLYTVIFLNFYAVAMIGFNKESFTAKLKVFMGLNVSCLIALALTGWLVIPNIIKNSHWMHRLSIESFVLPSPNITSLLTWTSALNPQGYGSYLGWSLLLLAGVGMVKAIFGRNVWALVMSLLCISSFILVFGKDIPGYSYIPWVYTQNSSGYYLLFSIFFISILCGYGYLFFERQGLKVRNWLAVGIILLVLLDLAPLTFQDSFNDIALHGRAKAYEWLTVKENKNTNVIDLYDSSDDSQAILTPIYTRFPVGNGPLLMEDIPQTRRLVRDLIKSLKDINFNQEKMNIEFLRKAFFLMNVEYVISANKLPKYLFQKIITFEKGLEIGELRHPAIALASKQVKPLKEGSVFTSPIEIKNIINDSCVQEDEMIMQTILLDPSQSEISKALPTQHPLAFTIIKSQIKQSEIQIEYSLNQNAFLHIARTYYPDLEVTIDGVRIDQVYKTALGFLALESSAGIHLLKIEPKMTLLGRILINIASVVFLFCIAIICFDIARGKSSSVKNPSRSVPT